jgi:hypothetical protein
MVKPGVSLCKRNILIPLAPAAASVLASRGKPSTLRILTSLPLKAFLFFSKIEIHGFLLKHKR